MPDFEFMGGRLSIFSGAVPEKAGKFFRDVWGDDPNSFQSAQPGVPVGSSMANGVREGITVAVNVQPARIDFSFGPSAPTGGAARLPTVSRDSVHRAMDRTINALPNIGVNRVACFLSLGRSAGDFTAANQILIEAIDEKYRPRNLAREEDFLLQYNTPVASDKINDMLIYRIQRYAVDRMQVLTFSSDIGFAPRAVESLVASISFDYNNKPTNKRFDVVEARVLGSEICTLAFSDAHRYTRGN